jgi:hypothetical protein
MDAAVSALSKLTQQKGPRKMAGNGEIRRCANRVAGEDCPSGSHATWGSGPRPVAPGCLRLPS